MDKNLGKTWPFFGFRQPWYHRMKRVTLQEMNLHEFMAASRSKKIQTTLYSSFTTKLTVSSMCELVMVVACGPVQRSSPPNPVQWLLTANLIVLLEEFCCILLWNQLTIFWHRASSALNSNGKGSSTIAANFSFVRYKIEIVYIDACHHNSFTKVKHFLYTWSSGINSWIAGWSESSRVSESGFSIALICCSIKVNVTTKRKWQFDPSLWFSQNVQTQIDTCSG